MDCRRLTLSSDGNLEPDVREKLLQIADLCPIGKTLGRRWSRSGSKAINRRHGTCAKDRRGAEPMIGGGGLDAEI
jgi:hypothetical protein